MAAKASGVLTLDTAPFMKSLEAAKVALKGFAVAVAGIALAAVAGFAVLGVGVYKIVSAFKDGLIAAFQFGKEMNSAARQMQGVGVGNFFLIQKALEKSGMSADEARSSIKEMSETGMSWDKLWKTPTAAANAIAAAKKDFGPMADALSKGAAAVDGIRNIIDSLNMKFATFFQAFLAGIVEPLKYLLAQINGAIDLSTLGTMLGDKLGRAMTQWIGGIANGNIGEVLGAQLKLAWIDLTEEIDKFFKEAGTSVGGIKGQFGKVFSDSATLIGVMLLSAFTQGSRLIGDVLSNSWKLLMKLLREAQPRLFGLTGEAGRADKEYARLNNESKELEAKIKNATRITAQDIEEQGPDATDQLRDKYKGSLQEKVDEDKLKAIKKAMETEYARFLMETGADVTPGQRAAVEAQDKARGSSKLALREAEDAANAKAILLARAELKKSSAGLTGVLGYVATQLTGAAGAVAGSKENAEKVLETADVTAIIAKELEDFLNPPTTNTAPPLVAGKQFEALTTSLGKVGGGGGSFITGQTSQERIAEQTLINAQRSKEVLDIIKDNTNPENPKAIRMFGAMLA